MASVTQYLANVLGKWDQKWQGTAGAAHVRAISGTSSTAETRFFTASAGHNWFKNTFSTGLSTIYVSAANENVDGATAAWIALAIDLANDAAADLIFTGSGVPEAVNTTTANDDVVAVTDAGFIVIPCNGEVHEIVLTAPLVTGLIYGCHTNSDGAGTGSAALKIWMAAS